MNNVFVQGNAQKLLDIETKLQEKKYMKTKILLPLILITLLFSCTKSREFDWFKDYIIEHKTQIKSLDENHYYIESTEHYYYKTISIMVMNDSSYSCVFWGDRTSWMWDMKKDRKFFIDIPYNRSSGIDVERDVELFKCFESK